MQYSARELESMARWQEMRSRNYQRSRQMLEEGNHSYAIQYQELQALCHEAVIQILLQAYTKE